MESGHSDKSGSRVKCCQCGMMMIPRAIYDNKFSVFTTPVSSHCPFCLSERWRKEVDMKSGLGLKEYFELSPSAGWVFLGIFVFIIVGNLAGG